MGGNGITCSDVNECTLGTDLCSVNGICTNTIGSYSCACKTGYTGDGFIGNCKDVDECALNTDNCHTHATCTNNIGSYTCACNNGYYGNGVACTEIRCSSIAIPTNAYQVKCTNGWKWGSVCDFICHTGYILDGHSDTTCRGDGSSLNGAWDHNTTPTCRGVLKCPSLGVIENLASLHCTDGDNYGSICTVNCQVGHSVHGNSVFQCTQHQSNSHAAAWKGSAECRPHPKKNDTPAWVIVLIIFMVLIFIVCVILLGLCQKGYRCLSEKKLKQKEQRTTQQLLQSTKAMMPMLTWDSATSQISSNAGTCCYCDT